MMLHSAAARAPLRGRLRPPGDKSISHRAVILAGLAKGESRVEHWLASADVRATRRAMCQLGAEVTESDGGLSIVGTGGGGLTVPSRPLDMGNSGTAMRLLAGVLAAQPFDSVLTGDRSLNARPMRRIILPLEAMGASITASPEGTAPLRISGNPGLHGIDYVSPVASAQIKSCVLLAGLYASGRTSVTEPRPSRDHTERMLPLFGVKLAGACTVEGGSRLQAGYVEVPADPSSAAFLAAAALLVPDSEVELTDVALNETRTAFYRVIEAMGADVTYRNRRQMGNEPVGDITVRYSGRLRGIEVPPEWIPAMIDEVPVLLALAAVADGTTRIREAAELRVKESDRLAVMARALQAVGIAAQERGDGVDVQGGSAAGARVHAADDHRCAMSLAVLGLTVEPGLTIDGAGYIDTSYPGFLADMARIGADRLGPAT